MSAQTDPNFEDMDDAALMAAFNAGQIHASEGMVEEAPASEEGEADDTVQQDALSGSADKLEDAADPEQAIAGSENTPHHTEAQQTEKPAEEAQAAPNFEELYHQIMQPFKANGREFKPESPDEAVKLMRLGANYTKKMQQLAPNIRLMRMLENNDLLSEEKINYLIDLTKNNPGAVQKLLKESNIDPLDVNVTEEVNYQPGNHRVSDNEVAFSEALNTVAEMPTGRDTIQHINSTWDRESQASLYKDPALLEVIHTQRENGIYAKITAEVDRQRTLGNLANVPFIQAYYAVGNMMQEAGLLAPSSNTSAGQQNPVPGAQETVLQRRAEPQRKPMSNGDKARAASPAPRTSPANKPKHDEFSPFTLSDEEVLRLTNSRF